MIPVMLSEVTTTKNLLKNLSLDRITKRDKELPIRVEPQLECNPTADLLRWLLRWDHGCDGDGGFWFRLWYDEWKGALDHLRGALLRVVDDDGLSHCANR